LISTHAEDGHDMSRGKILEFLQPMLADFKREIAEMRLAGASQADIDCMLDEFEEAYAADGDVEGELIVAVLRQAAHLPH
jgi:hypothetical protein